MSRVREPSQTLPLRFGFPPTAANQRKPMQGDVFSSYLTHRLGVPVETHTTLSYQDLIVGIADGHLDAAWLPPFVFVELDRQVGLSPIAATQRGGGVGYYSVMFTRIDSTIAGLESVCDRSVGWVDPASAAGYIYPRLQLATLGIDPTSAFQEELFLRSHAAVVRAVYDRAVDLGATYLHLDPHEQRKVIRAGWRPPPEGVQPNEIRWLEPFGPLPPDVIAASTQLAARWVDKLREAFLRIHREPTVRTAADQFFGTSRFVSFDGSRYNVLHDALDTAENQGVEGHLTFRPSTTPLRQP